MTHQQLVAVIDGVICEHRTGISRGVPAPRSQRDLSNDLERFESHRGVRRVRQALLLARNRRFLSVPRGLWLLMGLLTLTNAALSVLWR